MTKTHLVLFDIDGTLLHSGGCGRAATLLALQDVFGTVGAIDDVDFAGKTDWQILLEALEPAGFSGQAIQTQLITKPSRAGCVKSLRVSQYALVPARLKSFRPCVRIRQWC